MDYTRDYPTPGEKGVADYESHCLRKRANNFDFPRNVQKAGHHSSLHPLQNITSPDHAPKILLISTSSSLDG